MEANTRGHAASRRIPYPAMMSERIRRLFKEGFWIVLGQLMQVLGSLIGVRLLTGLLDPAAYGELALGMTIAMLVNQTMLGPLGNGVIRFYAPAQERSDLRGYLLAVRRLVSFATGIVVVIAILAVSGLLIAGRAKWIAITVAALIFSVLNGYNAILSGIQNAARQRSIVALHQGVDSWARFLVAAGSIALLGATSAIAMGGYLAAAALVLVSQSAFFRRVIARNAGNIGSGPNWQGQIWSFSWPISIFGIFTWMQLASDRWALGLLATTHDVGMYTALFQLGYYPISIATGVAVQFLTPIVYQRAGDASDSRRNSEVNVFCRRLAGLAAGITVVVFLLTLMVHAQIFRFFVAEKYGAVSYLLPWMILAGGIFAAGQIIALNLLSQMRSRTMMFAKIATALLGIALNFVGAYWYGTAGIVIAAVSFAVVFFFSMAVLSGDSGLDPCL